VGGVTRTFFQDDVWQIDWPDTPDDTDLYGAVGHTQWPGYGPWAGDGKTVTVDLWRIEGDVTPDSCSSDNPQATLVASNSATPAINTWAASQKVSGSRFAATGGDATYTFVVTWPGDDRTMPYTSVCGERSETIRVVTAKPDMVTQLVTPADAPTSTVETAQAQETGLEVTPAEPLVDVLHVWSSDVSKPLTDMSGWQATWQAYFLPAQDQTHEPEIVDDPSGQRVYSNATCTDETLYWTADQPVPVEQAGDFASPEFTAPDQPGSLFVVETITDSQGQVLRRGVCGAVAESAIIPAPPAPPTPLITTKAPADATVGDKISDETTLTGPYATGTVIQWWVQHTDYVDDTMPADQLQCVKPDPDDMTGATKIGETVLDHDIADGVTETIHSPEFTADKTGCTHIKEIALTPADSGDQQVTAQGWFGQTNETTHWHQPPSGPHAETGGTVLPNTGMNLPVMLVAVAVFLIGAGVATTVIVRRRLANTGQ